MLVLDTHTWRKLREGQTINSKHFHYKSYLLLIGFEAFVSLLRSTMRCITTIKYDGNLWKKTRFRDSFITETFQTSETLILQLFC